MSDTPRTDALRDSSNYPTPRAELWRFASELERELALCNEALAAARAELGRERMRLAACGAVALANTPESAAEARAMADEYRSASCDDVIRAVDEEMRLRAELERAMEAIAKIAAARDAVSGKPMYAPEMTRLLMAIEDARQLEAGR